MIQGLSQNIVSFAQNHPYQVVASTLSAVVAVECAFAAITNLYGYANVDNDFDRKSYWENLKVDLGGVATYGILASNYLAPITGALGSGTFVVYSLYKTQIADCRREEVYHMTWIVGHAPAKIWHAVEDIFTQRPIVVTGVILTSLVVIKAGAIQAALSLFGVK